MRTLPASARIVVNGDDAALAEVMQMGCWSEQQRFSAADRSADFYLDEERVLHQRDAGRQFPLALPQAGIFNALNATAAAVAAHHAGVTIEASLGSLERFAGVRRRQEIIAEIDGVRIIDDFAHHPTAIAATLGALRGQTPGRLIGVLDIRSNTMRMGVHAEQLGASFAAADMVMLCENPNLNWDMRKMAQTAPTIVVIKQDIQQIIDSLKDECRAGDQIVIMSNGGFEGLHLRLIDAMKG